MREIFADMCAERLLFLISMDGESLRARVAYCVTYESTSCGLQDGAYHGGAQEAYGPASSLSTSGSARSRALCKTSVAS